MPRKSKVKPAANCPAQYPYHGNGLVRLNRVIGQLEGARRMIEDRRYCPEILALLRGARAAIKGAEGEILEAYLASCVTHAFESNNARDKQQKIKELKEIFKRFEE